MKVGKNYFPKSSFLSMEKDYAEIVEAAKDFADEDIF